MPPAPAFAARAFPIIRTPPNPSAIQPTLNTSSDSRSWHSTGPTSSETESG
jgi:hypothetical protein